MPLRIQHRIRDAGLLIVFRQQNRRSQVNRTTPKLGQQSALNPEPFHPFRVGGKRNRRNHLIAAQRDPIPLRRIERHLFRDAVQIPRRTVPVLAFPLIVVHPDGVPVGSFEIPNRR